MKRYFELSAKELSYMDDNFIIEDNILEKELGTKGLPWNLITITNLT